MEFIPIVVIGVLFWFLMIRPQSKRQKKMASMQQSLQPGDEVMLTSGVFATVHGVDDEQGRLHVQVAPGVVLQVARGAIANVESSIDEGAEDPAEHEDAAGELDRPTDDGGRTS